MLGILTMRILGYTNLAGNIGNIKLYGKHKKGEGKGGGSSQSANLLFANLPICQFFSGDLKLEKQKRLTY